MCMHSSSAWAWRTPDVALALCAVAQPHASVSLVECSSNWACPPAVQLAALMEGLLRKEQKMRYMQIAIIFL